MKGGGGIRICEGEGVNGFELEWWSGEVVLQLSRDAVWMVREPLASCLQTKARQRLFIASLDVYDAAAHRRFSQGLDTSIHR